MHIPIKITKLKEHYYLAQDPFGGTAMGATREEAVERIGIDLSRDTNAGNIIMLEVHDFNHYLKLAGDATDSESKELFQAIGEARVENEHREACQEINDRTGFGDAGDVEHA